MQKPKPFNKTVIEEGGYRVEFSNQGGLPKFNPNPINFDKRYSTCQVEGCKTPIKNMWGICKNHKKLDKKSKSKEMKRLDHTVDWIGRIIPEGKTREECARWAPAHSEMLEILILWLRQYPEERGEVVDHFMDDILESIVGKIKDATTMQKEYESGKDTPDKVVETVMKVVDKYFPEGIKDKVDWLQDGRYKNLKDVPIRILVALLGMAFASEESNRGDYWFCKSIMKNENKSHYASAYMSAAYYYLRRYTKATFKQAKMSLKS